jgi:hypothetical protein
MIKVVFFTTYELRKMFCTICKTYNMLRKRSSNTKSVDASDFV